MFLQGWIVVTGWMFLISRMLLIGRIFFICWMFFMRWMLFMSWMFFIGWTFFIVWMLFIRWMFFLSWAFVTGLKFWEFQFYSFICCYIRNFVECTFKLNWFLVLNFATFQRPQPNIWRILKQQTFEMYLKNTILFNYNISFNSKII